MCLEKQKLRIKKEICSIFFLSVICNIFVLFFKAYLHIYLDLEINDTWAHRCTLQYCKVPWCGLYHLLVGICENGYPLAHIPTDK